MTIGKTFGWMRTEAGGGMAWTHPTAGRADRDPVTREWRATRPDGLVIPRTFTRPGDARRALGSPE